MRRKIMEKLKEWRDTGDGRLPLLLYGVRQAGKTYVLKEFGNTYFDNVVYVNFEEDRVLSAYLDLRIDPSYVIKTIENVYHVRIIPQKTLLIFDEVQSCERALTSLKYFAEQAPEYCVVAAGSLLGVVINRQKYSFPVGKVKLLQMYPMNMEEFLWAKDKTLLADTIYECFVNNKPMPALLHHEALELYQEYMFTGGMPAVITAHLSGENENEIKNLLYNSYVADMVKYAEKGENVKIAEAYDSLGAQLARDNKKFQYKMIRKGARASLYGHALDWLIQAGIVLKCTKCTQGNMPLNVYEDSSSFKLYFSDTGLFTAHANLTRDNLAQAAQFSGALVENYVAASLKAQGYALNYWTSKFEAEVDFLIIKDGNVIPVECKVNVHVKSKSLTSYVKQYAPAYSIRISARNFGYEDGIKSVPLYAVFCL